MNEKSKKYKKRRKVLVTLAILLGSFLLIAGAYLLFVHFSMKEYYARSEKAFAYPQLSTGFIPQGIAYDAEEDSFFLTGYKIWFQPSPVYVVDKDSGRQKAYATLRKEDGTAFTGHAGGIGLFGDYVYVNAGYEGTYVYSRSQILHAKNGEPVKPLGQFDAVVNTETLKSSFCTVHEGLLTIGEFHFDIFLRTDKSHHLEAPSGDRTKALAVSYPLDAGSPLGVDLQHPAAVYALHEIAQGLCFDEDSVYVSFSFGAALSGLSQYDRRSLTASGTWEGVPLYFLDSASCVRSFRIPPHSEELEIVDQKLYIMYESAANLYLHGKLLGGDMCYSTPLPLPLTPVKQR